MTYQFEQFKGTNQKTENKITVTSSNSFGLPSGFFKKNFIDKFRYASLYYDKDNKAVGLHFHNNDNEEHKFSIVKSGKYGGSIVATSFFKINGISPKKYKGKYKWKKIRLNEEKELFVINLKKVEGES